MRSRRAPKFPIIVRSRAGLLAVKSRRHVNRVLTVDLFPGEKPYDVIDVTGEGFSLYGNRMIISPLTLKKRWTKREMIALYNNEIEDSDQASLYPTTSLSSQRVEQIVREIVALISQRRSEPAPGSSS